MEKGVITKETTTDGVEREEVLSWNEVMTVVLQKSVWGLILFNILPNVFVTKTGIVLLKFTASRNSEDTAVSA